MLPLAVLLTCWLPLPASAQTAGGERAKVASVRVKGPVVAKRGQAVTVPVVVTVLKPYHVTSATPGDRYLKPLRLSWDKGALLPDAPLYPEAQLRKYPFSEGKLSVLEGEFTIQQTFRVPAATAQGFGAITGKLNYQACTETECLAPATIPVRLSYDIR